MNGARKADLPVSLPEKPMCSIDIKRFIKDNLHIKYVDIYTSISKAVNIYIHNVPYFTLSQVEEEWKLHNWVDKSVNIIYTLDELKNEILKLEPEIRPELILKDDDLPANIGCLLLTQKFVEILYKKMLDAGIRADYEFKDTDMGDSLFIIKLNNNITFKLIQITRCKIWEIGKIDDKNYKDVDTFADVIDYINNHLDK